MTVTRAGLVGTQSGSGARHQAFDLEWLQPAEIVIRAKRGRCSWMTGDSMRSPGWWPGEPAGAPRSRGCSVWEAPPSRVAWSSSGGPTLPVGPRPRRSRSRVPAIRPRSMGFAPVPRGCRNAIPAWVRRAATMEFCRGARDIPNAAATRVARARALGRSSAARPITGQASSRRRIKSAISKTGSSAVRSNMSAVASTAVATHSAPRRGTVARRRMSDRVPVPPRTSVAPAIRSVAARAPMPIPVFPTPAVASTPIAWRASIVAMVRAATSNASHPRSARTISIAQGTRSVALATAAPLDRVA
jgi:hypothetical protein